MKGFITGLLLMSIAAASKAIIDVEKLKTTEYHVLEYFKKIDRRLIRIENKLD